MSAPWASTSTSSGESSCCCLVRSCCSWAGAEPRSEPRLPLTFILRINQEHLMDRIASSQRVKSAIWLAVAATVLSATTLCAQTPPPIMLGTAWYPEQWPESRWDADLAL